ncbi:endoglucanase A-like [Ruditapes philippinarum]|uniref:endoglucanase A-like n=1 Tax=Ruditapes philippinarum TaxID=129788 RepID=UPI00295ABC25|nr:endoglucanase A-like [Ruditapes philippinarum]
MLDCIKWPLDFFLKCWRKNDNELYGQVGNGGIDHSKMMRPEDMTASNMQRPAYKVTSARGGSDLAGSMVVAFAVGSMAFKNKDPDYSAKLLDAAESLYVFADKYREKYTAEISDAGNFYSSSSYEDELVYAAAMLYKATNKASYLTDAEQKYNQFNFDGKTPWAFDWDDKTIATKVLLYEATGKTTYKQGIQNFLNSYSPQGNVQYTPGGLAWRSKWGSLRYTANVAFIALMAADLGIDAEANKNWAKGQIDYMLGDNPRSSSYVVGFGNNPPKQPHHKSSTCQPKPAACDWGVFSDTSKANAFVLYGALVGGPDASDNYKDVRTDYIMAEVTCDYNAGFQSAVAGLVHFKNK